MSAPLVVNTKDGVCWTRRAVTSHGIALYAPEAVRTCPEFVMATLDELAEHGIVGSAFVVPAPVGPEPDEVASGERPLLSVRTHELVEMEADRNRWKERAAELEAEREKLVRWHGEDSKTITTLVARVDRRRARLVALQNDALSMRGLLAPNGEDRKVPFPLGETLTPAVDWLINRVTELEVAAIEGRAALAALCHDLEDPGSNAFGALFLLQQATPGTPMEPGERTPTVYRASHDSIGMGLYLTAAAARARCEASAREAISGDISLDWIEDEEDGVAELVVTRIDGSEYPSGYVVHAMEAATSYDEGADE